MSWLHWDICLVAGILAGMSGGWCYAVSHRKWDWRDAVASVGYSSMAGVTAVLIGCKWLCHSAEDAALLAGLCSLGGLIGFTPKKLRVFTVYLLKFLIRGLGDDPKLEQRPDPNDRPSDA